MTPYSIRNRRGEIVPIGSAYIRSLSPVEATPIIRAARKPSKWPIVIALAAVAVVCAAAFLLLDGHSEADDARATAAALLDAQAQAQTQLGAQK